MAKFFANHLLLQGFFFKHLPAICFKQSDNKVITNIPPVIMGLYHLLTNPLKFPTHLVRPLCSSNGHERLFLFN